MADFEESCVTWRKSTASNSGGCVEVAPTDASVLIRDSVSPDGPILRVSTAAWSVFVTSVAESGPLGSGDA